MSWLIKCFGSIFFIFKFYSFIFVIMVAFTIFLNAHQGSCNIIQQLALFKKVKLWTNTMILQKKKSIFCGYMNSQLLRLSGEAVILCNVPAPPLLLRTVCLQKICSTTDVDVFTNSCSPSSVSAQHLISSSPLYHLGSGISMKSHRY